jgi:hypothetical protein
MRSGPGRPMKYTDAERRVYGAWRNMHQRCYNSDAPGWSRYGGRGITVCVRWSRTDGLKNFTVDMGPRPTPRHELDRYPDNDGNYEPNNCRWATKSQQNRNRRRNRRLTFDGRVQTLQAWADEVGVPQETLRSRIRGGWSVERALSTPRDTRYLVSHTKPRQTKRARLLTFRRKTKTIAEWSRVVGIHEHTIFDRLARNWSINKALSTPSTHSKN